jgi:hypothetical protein
MKYIIESNDISELLDGLNNAIIAYKEVVNSIEFRCSIPRKLLPLKDVPSETLKNRLVSLKQLYTQLLEFESKLK